MKQGPGLRHGPLQARSQKRLQVILDKAGELLEAEGAEAMNTNRLAGEAGVPIASLYHYFPNKQAVLVALGQRWLDRVLAVVDAVEACVRPEDGLADFLDACLNELAGCYRDTPGLDALQHAMILLPEMATLEAQHDRRVLQQMFELFRRGGMQGTDAEVFRLVETVFVASHYLLLLWRGKPIAEQPAALAEVQLLCRRYVQGHRSARSE